MTVDVQHETSGKYLRISLSGKLDKADYEQFVPEIERVIKEQGKLRLLVLLHDFHGWDLSALWEDIKFDLKHFRDIERLALVGHSKWEQGMAAFCKPFTTAQLRYFDESKLAEAEQWIQS